MGKSRLPKRPRDVNQLAQRIMLISVGEEADALPIPVNPKRAKRGEARAASLTPARRKKIAKKAANVRWHKAS